MPLRSLRWFKKQIDAERTYADATFPSSSAVAGTYVASAYADVTFTKSS